ncbi:hypothetical protein P5V15_004546 [Pogonomyrmex californicus]
MKDLYKFKISAPGTICLYGDPILGYERPSIVAALKERINLEFSSLPRKVNKGYIRLAFTDLKLSLNISLYALFKHFRCFRMQNVNHRFHYTLINNVNRFLGSLNINNGIYDPGNKAQHLSLKAFLYLFVFVTYKENIEMTATINMKISSDLEMGKGLGSSAAFVTCLAACFWHWSLLQKGIVRKFNDDDFQKIDYYAWSCEKIIYNGQCKSNIYGSIHGTIIMLKNSHVCIMDSIPPMHILLIDTNINQEKKTVQMEEMHHLCPCTDFIVISIESMFPQLFAILLAICKIYVDLRESNIEWNIQFAKLDSYYKNLLSFINRNQSLLKALGLSNQNINLICAIAQKYLCGCKMICTSGYVFILPLLDNYHTSTITTPRHMDQLKQELKSYHFSVNHTYISCKGLAID